MISRLCFDHLKKCLQAAERTPLCCASSADVESKTLQGGLGELVLDRSGLHLLENTTLDFQKLPDKEILRIKGPLGADFTIKVRVFEVQGGLEGEGGVPEGLLISAGPAGQ